MWRYALFCAALLAADASAAPAPIAKPAAEVRLHVSTKTPAPLMEGDHDLDVELTLTNTTARRVEVPLFSYGSGLDGSSGLTFVLRFADGTVHALRSVIDDPPDTVGDQPKPRPSPISLAAKARTNAVSEVLSRRLAPYWMTFRNNKGRFTLTVTIPKLGVKSNTIRYHDCPLPPDDFDPLAHQGR